MTAKPTSDDPNVFTDQSQMLVALTRMEAKMDVGFAQLVAESKQNKEDLTDHESRLRILEARPAASEDHEGRLRTLEARRTVSPRALWTSITAGGGFLLALLSIFEKLLGGF